VFPAVDFERPEAWRQDRAAWRSRVRGGDRRQQMPGFACRDRPLRSTAPSSFAMIDPQCARLTDLSLAFVDSLARHRGGILNVASMAGFVPGRALPSTTPPRAFVCRSARGSHAELKPAACA